MSGRPADPPVPGSGSRATGPGAPRGGGAPGDTPPEPVGRLARAIAGKAVPLYLSMLATMAGSMVTAGVLGNAGTAALAAHALVVAVLNPVLMLTQGALRGSMPFVAEHEDDPDALAPVVRHSALLAVLMGSLGGSLVASVPLWAGPLGVAEPTVAALGTYPPLMGAWVVLAAVKSSMTVLLIGLGRGRSVLALSLVSTGTVVVLTPALILGAGPAPELGLAGAAVALLVDGGLTVLLAMYVVRRRTVLRRIPVWRGAPRWSGLWAIARVGLPTGSTLLVKFGTMSVLAMAVARTTAADAATHQLLVVIASFAFLPAVAAGQASIPFTARAAGRGDRAGVRRSVVAGYLVSLPVVALSTAAIWVASAPVVGLLTADPQVRAGVATLLPVLFVVTVLDAAQSQPGMGLMGIRNTLPSLYSFAVCYGLLALAAVPLAGLGGLTLLWAAYAVATLGLVVGQGLAFRRLSARV
ncbi:MATE family efflux transporter [Nocardiopsis lucentensis]|uniref:MATE family efflux transporter n=1 Tax=Nocardiopsis lucentensis TaxID=53441 RepID=UPI00034827E6|nr:MATE family efflux transporter [Nocardiopsis lucentensis]